MHNTGVNLRCIVLNKSSLTLKPTYSMILFIWHFDKVSPFFRGRKQISGYLIIGARGRFDLQRNREMFGGGETIPYPDCGCGYVCHNQQTFTLRGVDFTVLVIPTFF